MVRFWLSGPRIGGIRPGISFSPNDLARLSAPSPQTQTATACNFVYVIRGDHGLRKIGISANPNARLAQLRTASPFPLDLEFVALVENSAFEIEQSAHAMLAHHRQAGEWFACDSDHAVAAVSAAAHRLNAQLATVAPKDIEKAIAAAAGQPVTASTSSPFSPPKSATAEAKLFIILALLGMLAFVIFLIHIGSAQAGEQRDTYGGNTYGGERQSYGSRESYSGGHVGGWYQNGHWDENCQCWERGRWRD